MVPFRTKSGASWCWSTTTRGIITRRTRTTSRRTRIKTTTRKWYENGIDPKWHPSPIFFPIQKRRKRSAGYGYGNDYYSRDRYHSLKVKSVSPKNGSQVPIWHKNVSFRFHGRLTTTTTTWNACAARRRGTSSCPPWVRWVLGTSFWEVSRFWELPEMFPGSLETLQIFRPLLALPMPSRSLSCKPSRLRPSTPNLLGVR